MNAKLQRVVVVSGLALLLVAGGCTSARVHAPGAGFSPAAELEIGEVAKIGRLGGLPLEIRITAVGPASLQGEATGWCASWDPAECLAEGERVSIPLRDVETIEVTRFDGSKTIKNVAGAAAVAALAAVFLAGVMVAGVASAGE